MNTSKFTWLVLGLFSSLALSGCQSTKNIQADFAFVGANVINIETGDIQYNQVVLIDKGEIVHIEGFEQSVLPDNLETVFATGQFLIPGLMDSHVHAFGDTQTAIHKTLPLFLANGITHVRDMGSTLENLKAVRLALKSEPGFVHPNFISAGPLIDGKKLSWYEDLQLVISDADDVPNLLNTLEANSIQQVKVYSNLDPKIHAVVASKAGQRGMKLVGHLPKGVSIREASERSQHTIEHLNVSSMVSCAPKDEDWVNMSINARFQQGFDEYFSLMTHFWQSIDWENCAEQWRAFAQAGGYLTPTLVMETSDSTLVDKNALPYLDVESRNWCDKTLDDIKASEAKNQLSAYTGLKQSLDNIVAAGVPLLAGTDTPNHCLVAGFSLGWELTRMVGFGLSPLTALQTATLNPAIAFSGRPRLVKAGHAAELVLLENNPLINISAITSINGVYSQGQWYDNSRLRQIKKSALEYSASAHSR